MRLAMICCLGKQTAMALARAPVTQAEAAVASCPLASPRWSPPGRALGRPASWRCRSARQGRRKEPAGSLEARWRNGLCLGSPHCPDHPVEAHAAQHGLGAHRRGLCQHLPLPDPLACGFLRCGPACRRRPDGQRNRCWPGSCRRRAACCGRGRRRYDYDRTRRRGRRACPRCGYRHPGLPSGPRCPGRAGRRRPARRPARTAPRSCGGLGATPASRRRVLPLAAARWRRPGCAPALPHAHAPPARAGPAP
mmetsp:Transcript_93017/g.240360  ORF Transcript_93017/g.240360 Transcript_93017/m.240360 type:complete len:251 (+) Transcript_93017:405-1157(+)